MDTREDIRVLVIDDEEALRHGVRRILEMEGYHVETAANGTQGISLGTKGEFDLALIDLKMPDMSGIDVLREIRTGKPNTVCFMATAYASYETAVEATKLGADGYILKPFSADELLQQLNNGYRKRLLLLETERLRKEREESMLEVAFERTRLKTIINSISEGVLVINRKGESVYFNQAALKLIDSDYLPIGLPVAEQLPPVISAMIDEHFLQPESQEKTYTVEVEIKPDNGLFVEATLSPVNRPDGSLSGVVVVLKDITEFKKLEQLKSQFVSMVAHELKAPIAASIGFLDLLRKTDLNLSEAQRAEYISRTHARLKSLVNMINDLLDISRMELNKVVREIQDVCVEETLAEVGNLLKLEAEKKGVTLSLPAAGNRHIVRIDPTEFLRLITNLMSNAIKYNKQGGNVYAEISADGHYTRVSVRDTGIGLKPEEKKKLFGEFFRAKNEHTKNIHGTGLGLSIVRRIVEAYSGRIECESEYGKGSTFTLVFPRLDENTIENKNA